jgi:transcriptional regulator with PAS, ATPase and Fis domain
MLGGRGLHLSTVAAERLLCIHISGENRAQIVKQLENADRTVNVVEGFQNALPALTQEPEYAVALIVAADRVDRFKDRTDSLIDGIHAIRRVSSQTQIILAIEASTDISFCCRAVTSGVAGFVELKSGALPDDALGKRLEEAVTRFKELKAEAAKLHTGEIFDKTGIVGCSRLMAQVLSQTGRAAMVSDAPVLIHGESGAGKQLLAEMIHRLDPKRCNKPFLSVNCAAITGTLAESALFGHVKGAFTGAAEARAGYFRAADGGTVFLDEIGDLSPELQPKLLRFLQEGLVLPVGSDTEFPVDVRIVAAGNRRIPALVESGEFRLDLYQRLNVIALDLPPLRERKEDIPLLIDFFVKKYAQSYDRRVTSVSPRVVDVLSRSALEGNVRELENIIRRAIAMKTGGDELTLNDLPPGLLNQHAEAPPSDGPLLSKEMIEQACGLIASGEMSLGDFVDECERLVLSHAINELGENNVNLSERLGVSTRTLYNKRRKYSI